MDSLSAGLVEEIIGGDDVAEVEATCGILVTDVVSIVHAPEEVS